MEQNSLDPTCWFVVMFIDPNCSTFLNLGVTREEPGLVNGLGFVKDLWLSYDFQNDWRVRLGQFKIHQLGRNQHQPGIQLAVERTLSQRSDQFGAYAGHRVHLDSRPATC